MASTNQSPFYQRAEQEFHAATTDEDRISCLEIMIKECPKHKSSENMLRNLTNRLKKLKEGVERRRKSGKGSQKGIKKSDMQLVIAGPPNSGKSTIFQILTKQKTKISPHPFTTFEPKLGTTKYQNVKIQTIDGPPFPNHEKSLINSTDTLLIVLEDIKQLKNIKDFLYRSLAKKIYLFNKSDKLNGNEIRKLEANLKSKQKGVDFLLFSSLKPPKTEIDNLKKKIFKTFPILRIYTKEPKKEATIEPMIMKRNSTVEDAAEKILKGMSEKIKRARIWGPSSKFAGQVVGLDHFLKDKDIIEFQTK